MWLAALACVLFAAAMAPTLTAATDTKPEQGLDHLSWLQGCWEAKSSNRVVEERWTAPRGGAMVGLGTTVLRDTLVEYELIALRYKDGAYTYEAHPSGQSVATFTAKVANDTMVVFTNRSHDFPQEVGYRKSGADSLIAWIGGTVKDKPRRVEFRYARARCTGDP